MNSEAEWTILILLHNRNISPEGTSLINKTLYNIITKHEENLIHDIKGYNWIYPYRKKNITRAASAVFSFLWHTDGQNKHMDIFDT